MHVVKPEDVQSVGLVAINSKILKQGKLQLLNVKLLKKKSNLLHTRNKSAPRCEHFPPQL